MAPIRGTMDSAARDVRTCAAPDADCCCSFISRYPFPLSVGAVSCRSFNLALVSSLIIFSFLSVRL